MKARLTSFALALALLGAFLMLPGSAIAQQAINNPIDLTGVPCTVAGIGSGVFTPGSQLDIMKFAVQNRQLGTL